MRTHSALVKSDLIQTCCLIKLGHLILESNDFLALQAGAAAQLEEAKADLAELQSQEQQLHADLQQLQTKHTSLQVAARRPTTRASWIQCSQVHLLLHLALLVRFHTCCVSL